MLNKNLDEYLGQIEKTFQTISIVKEHHPKNGAKRFTVKDGIIKFDVTLSTNPKCNMCNRIHQANTDLYRCRHIYYILIRHYQMSDVVLTFLWREPVFETFLTESDSPDRNRILEDTIYDELSDDECCICLESYTDNVFQNQNIHQCVRCYKCVHLKCYETWRASQRQATTRDCAHCMSRREL